MSCGDVSGLRVKSCSASMSASNGESFSSRRPPSALSEAWLRKTGLDVEAEPATLDSGTVEVEIERSEDAELLCALGPDGSRGRGRSAAGEDLCPSGMVKMIGAGYLC